MTWRSGNGTYVMSGMNDAAATPAPDIVETCWVREALC